MAAISAAARDPTRCGDDGRVAQDARYALRDAAKNLVAQRPRPAREIVDGDRFAAVAADEGHCGAQSGVRLRHVGDVDHQHVHAHGADDGNATAARPARSVAHMPRIAVGIADGKRGDARRPRGPPQTAVADRRPDRNVMDRHDARRQPQRGSRPATRYVTGRHRTEQRQPRPHRRQPRAREANGGGAVGGVVREVGEAARRACSMQASNLSSACSVMPRVGQVRRRQVRAETGEPERGQIVEAREHGGSWSTANPGGSCRCRP